MWYKRTMSHKHKKQHDENQPAEPSPAQNDVPATEGGGKAIDPAQQQIEELKGQLLRVAADYQNYQKRAQRQIEQSAQLMREDFAKQLLKVLDDLERVLTHGTQGTDVNSLLQGVQMVSDHFMKIMEGQGMKRLVVKPGDAFDPNLHEALMHQEREDFPENVVCQELMSGYVMNDRVIRPVKVAVAKKPASATPTEENKAEGDSQDDPWSDRNACDC